MRKRDIRSDAIRRRKLALLASIGKNCSGCGLPSESATLIRGRCHPCSEDLLADREKRIRLMLKCVRAGSGTIWIRGQEWYVSDLADLRRPLTKTKKR